MINKLAITNNVVIQKPQEIERPNNAPVQWNGKKVYVSHHDRHIWFTRIACPILIALGFTLIAAVGTMGAIFGGVTLIGFAGLAWLFLEVLHASSIYFIVNLYPKDENKLDPIVFVYDRKLKGKTFKFNFDGHVIPLKEDPKRASAFMIKIVNLIDFEYEKI